MTNAEMDQLVRRANAAGFDSIADYTASLEDEVARLSDPGAEWIEPWCEDHPNSDGQRCLACIGASHDAWMHRAKYAEMALRHIEQQTYRRSVGIWSVAISALAGTWKPGSGEFIDSSKERT